MIIIGKNTFIVPAPGGMKSFALQQKILPVAGRVISVFLQLLGASGSSVTKLLEADVLAILPQAMPHVGQIFGSMPAGELEAITRDLLQGSTCDKMQLFGAPGGDPFDAIMQGRTMDTWKLLFHALEVWYPDFFANARLSFGRDAKVNPSTESATSTPTAGPAGALS